ncbi:fluoride efflux transporter FluC [Cnuibacter sp. UC19_7]|uniref:fluoride efflux transporter FluC n=1 Tax=Cnuibacter sp. UC19_7 TaxID=3350166 RepID=UPI003672A2E3
MDARHRPEEDPRPAGGTPSAGGAHPPDPHPGRSRAPCSPPREEHGELPVDSDLVEPRALRPPRGVHLRPGLILLVAGGGAIGTALREAVSLAVPAVGGFPAAVFGINLVGAFVLGFLLEALSRRGPDTGRRRLLRLGLGTGVLGGFTTYSALAADSAVLLTGPEAWLGVVYALATVVLGAGATLAGIALASPRRAKEGAE